MKDPMGDRLKTYESVCENVLTPRLPVILRLDGNSFSRLTRHHKFTKPFDDRFEYAMDQAAVAVLEYCSGAQVAYTQSDEITIFLRNDQTRQTDPFLGNRTQKITSLTAATASVAFNRALAEKGLDTEAVFDCRAYVVPPHEVNNIFIWRQQDATRNAISGYAHWELRKAGVPGVNKLLHGLTSSQQQEVIFQKLGVNFNNLPVKWKRGRCLVRETRQVPVEEVLDAEKYHALLSAGRVQVGQLVTRSRWSVDTEIPLFSQDKAYIGRFLGYSEEYDENGTRAG